MKKIWTVACILLLAALCGCSIFNSPTLSSQTQPGDPVMSVTPGPLSEDMPVPAPPPANSGPIVLEGSGGGVIEIEPIPGPEGNTFNAAYMTWYINEGNRFREFRSAARLTLSNVKPGEYFLNFRWDTGRWVVENIPQVAAEHRSLNGRARIRLNNGPWHEFTEADTCKAGEYWNLRLVVP